MERAKGRGAGTATTTRGEPSLLCRKSASSSLEDGEVGLGVRSHQRGWDLLGDRRQGRAPRSPRGRGARSTTTKRRPSFDHTRVSDDVAIRAQDHPRAGASLGTEQGGSPRCSTAHWAVGRNPNLYHRRPDLGDYALERVA